MKIILSILMLMIGMAAKANPETQALMLLTNGVVYTPQTNVWMANSNGINAVIHHPDSTSVSNGVYNSTTSLVISNVAATLDGYEMLPVVATLNSNQYWLDFGKTNAMGFKLMYATLTATNDVQFVGPTNCTKWGLLSFNIVASGADRLIRFPTNFPHFTTNGFTLSGSVYQMTLTNGNEFRMSIQSNSTLSTLWTTFGQ